MDANNKPVLIYMTFANVSAAEQMARVMVEGRLVACVNILPGVTSVYLWDGEVTSASEVVAIAKTTAARVASIKDMVLAQHEYTCPACVVIAIDDGLPDYLSWITAQTSDSEM